MLIARWQLVVGLLLTAVKDKRSFTAVRYCATNDALRSSALSVSTIDALRVNSASSFHSGMVSDLLRKSEAKIRLKTCAGAAVLGAVEGAVGASLLVQGLRFESNRCRSDCRNDGMAVKLVQLDELAYTHQIIAGRGTMRPGGEGSERLA